MPAIAEVAVPSRPIIGLPRRIVGYIFAVVIIGAILTSCGDGENDSASARAVSYVMAVSVGDQRQRCEMETQAQDDIPSCISRTTAPFRARAKPEVVRAQRWDDDDTKTIVTVRVGSSNLDDPAYFAVGLAQGDSTWMVLDSAQFATEPTESEVASALS
jgi:hypothetical protein